MTEKSDLSYMGYQEMVADMTTALTGTVEIMKELEMPVQAEKAAETAGRLKSHIFSVGIMGEFKRGKSTVINALLGEEIAPADIIPASATLNRITWGPKAKARILFKDGKSQEVPVDRIAEYVTKLTDDSAAMAETVDQAVVEYPCEFCKNNVEIIDTPGLNDDDRMDAITESVVPKLDAVVFVVSASAPFGKSEAEFVRSKLMTSDVSRLIVIVNRIDDIYKASDRPKIVEEIRKRIVKEILDRTAAIHGEDSDIYRETKAKLADITLYPMSAIKALIGRTEHDQDLVEESGILDFEERLRKLLTEERGALEITRGMSVVADLLKQGTQAIELRMSTIEMSAEEFLRNQMEAQQKITELRANKKAEQERVRGIGKEIGKKINSMIDEKYIDLRDRLVTYFSSYPINPSELKSERDVAQFQTKVGADMEREVKSALSDYSEQLNVYLQKAMGSEYVKVQEYMGTLALELDNLRGRIKGKESAGTIGSVGIDAMSNLLGVFLTSNIFSATGLGMFGLGGMIEGFKEAGWKGGATGLVGGAAAGTAVGFALVTALGSVAFLPFALITGLAGTLGGKFLTAAIFGKDIRQKKINEIRDGLKKAAGETVDSLRSQNLIENWAQKQIEDQIQIVIDQIDGETEQMLTGMEDTLKAIAADMAKANQDKEQRMAQCDHIKKKIESITELIERITARIGMTGGQERIPAAQ